MPQYCCVPSCNNRSGGHTFPSKQKYAEVRRKWIVAIKRLDPITKKLREPTKNDVVCSHHFTAQDYVVRDHSSCLRKRLKPGAVPSVFKFAAKVPASNACQDRLQKRAKRRLTFASKSSTFTQPEIINEPEVDFVEDTTEDELMYLSDHDIGSEVKCTTEINDAEACVENVEILDISMVTDCVNSKPNASVESLSDVNLAAEEINTELKQGRYQNNSAQCNLFPHNGIFSIYRFENDPESVSYYTGFKNFKHFMLFFHCLGPAVDFLNYSCSNLTPVNECFLTVLKLRRARDDFDLGTLFGIKRKTAGKVFSTWIQFMYYQLKELDVWPGKDVVQATMPKQFKKQFPSTRVILDSTEIPISKPKNVTSQSATWSTYKNRNTLKVLVGCTPRGLVSFVSTAYGGSCTDRQIVERSNLITNNTFCEGDSIMADRGFIVQDLFASQKVLVNTPAMLKGVTQLGQQQLVKDRRIASKRIHIERVIGLGKTYQILKKEFNHSKTPIGHMIIFVCFMLSNFRESIVNNLA